MGIWWFLESYKNPWWKLELYCCCRSRFVSLSSLTQFVFQVQLSLFALTIWCIEAAVLVQWGPCKPATAFIAEKTSIFKVWQKSAFYFW